MVLLSLPLIPRIPFSEHDMTEVVTGALQHIASTGPSPDDNDRGLCRRCLDMLHGRGILDLFSSIGFMHSQLTSFGHRPNCQLCRFLWNEDLIGTSNQPQLVRRLRDLIKPYSDSRTGPRKVSQPDQSWVLFKALKGPACQWENLQVQVQSEKGRLLWEPVHHLRVVVPTTSPFAAFIPFRPLEWNGESSHSLAALNTLIPYCENSHDRCQLTGPRPLPTRVLRISGQPPCLQVHVHTSTEDQIGRYAALSYCWGGPQEVRLTTDNLDSRQEILLDSAKLPKTLEDAILTTHHLGLEYIWVDALCIIQDDPADKEREINRMCSIYENSAVTIAAATASSVEDGFLKPVLTLNTTHPSCTISLPCKGKNSERFGDVVIAPQHLHHTADLPINKRGWTFQEAFIPPRLLVFGDLEPFLRCRSSDTVRISSSFINYPSSRIEPQRIMDSSGITERDRQQQLRVLWKYIVEQYSIRQFSFAEDRPLAIKGVIDFLSKDFGCRCHFGIWTNYPIGHLLWTTTLLCKNEHIMPTHSQVPGIPTWSWMSIPSGEIDLSHLELLGHHRGEASVDFGESPHHQIKITCCVLNEAQVYEEDECVEWWPDLEADENEDFGTNSPITDDGDSSWEDLELFLLVLARTANNNVLAIRAVHEGRNVHRRIGVMEIRAADKWLSRPKRTVILR